MNTTALHSAGVIDLQHARATSAYVGVLSVLGAESVRVKDKQTLDSFFPFAFSMIFSSIAQRNSKAKGTAPREKEMFVAVAASTGWGPATCTVL